MDREITKPFLLRNASGGPLLKKFHKTFWIRNHLPKHVRDPSLNLTLEALKTLSLSGACMVLKAKLGLSSSFHQFLKKKEVYERICQHHGLGMA